MGRYEYAYAIEAARMQTNILAAINASVEADKIDNAQLDDITWAKVTKTGSSLADLATKSAGALNSGDLAAARMSANIVAAIAGLDPTFTTLTFDTTDTIKRNVNDSKLEISGGEDHLHGAFLKLFGGNYGAEPGIFTVGIGNYQTGATPDSKFKIAYFSNGSVTDIFEINKLGNINKSGVYDDTVAGTANVIVSAEGHLQRATSNEKHKKDIKDLEMDTTKIFQLRPRAFQWDHKIIELTNENGKIIKPGKIITKDHVGLIAEEVEAILPEFASHNIETGEPDGIEWNTITTGLITEVKKLRNEVNELKTK